jgi:hypothetical protein
MRFLIYIRNMLYIEANILNFRHLRSKHYEQHRHDKRKSRYCRRNGA